MERTLFEIKPGFDRPAGARRLADRSRVQIRDALKLENAREIQFIPQTTRGCVATHGGNCVNASPQSTSNAELATKAGIENANRLGQQAREVSERGNHGFRCVHYPIVDAPNNGLDPDGPYELLLECLKAPEFFYLSRQVTGISDQVLPDGQAAIIAAQYNLGLEIDNHVAKRWRVAFVLNFSRKDWRSDWGGYLSFLHQKGDIIQDFRPRINAHNFLALPQSHAVSYLPSLAPVGR